jgi:hypothetical protein
MSYAILNAASKVVQIVADKPDGVWAVKTKSGDGAAVGRVYNGWTFDAQKWTSYEFLRRFTAGEREDIRVAAASDGAVADLLMFLQTATEVVSDDPTTSVGMDYLVHLGILTPARRAELLT